MRRPLLEGGAPSHERTRVANSTSGWECCYYEDSRGRKPVKEFLLELEARDPEQADVVYAKLDLFTKRGWEGSLRSGLLCPVEGKVFEIKPKQWQVRVLGFAWRDRATGRRFFVAAAAEIKKEDQLGDTVKQQAAERRQDWFSRKR